MTFTSQDILLAQEVQNAALTSATTPLAGIDVATHAVSAQGLGGDFHLVLQATDAESSAGVGLVVGDVSGKGLPASLLATSIGHLLPWLRPLGNPARAFQALNKVLVENAPSDLYASMVFAEVDPEGGKVRLWSAGHPPAVLWRAATGRVEFATPSGNLLLGCFPDWQGSPQEWTWETGDVLILYSDGVLEARGPKGELFGTEGIASALEQCCGHARNAEEIAEAVMEQAHAWGTVSDDATLLVCRCTATGLVPQVASPQKTGVTPSVPAPSSPVRVLLVDDHAIWRDGMRSLLLDTEFLVVGEADSGDGAVARAAHLSPDLDLVLLDVRMAGGNGDGLDALEGIREAVPGAKVVMLTTYDHPGFRARAQAGGAAGYLLKGIERDQMLHALRRMVQGSPEEHKERDRTESCANGKLGRAAAAVADIEDGGELITPLSLREAEVLSLLSTGLSNQQIGERLFISTGTTKTHVEHIIHKLGVADRLQAAVWAARHGLAPEVVLEGHR